MLRNYLAAALRNLVRNRLYTAINIVGLTVGLVAALVIALFVRDELTFDTWVPGHHNVYRIAKSFYLPGRVTDRIAATSAVEALWFREDLPDVVAIARLWPEPRGVRRGQVEANETVVWTDPEFFEVFPIPIVAGDAKAALSQPDSVVITRQIARKYFGREDVVGEIVELDRRHPMRVTAVLEDLPSRSHFTVGIIASRLSAISPLIPAPPLPAGVGNVYAYVRLTPNGLPAVQAALTALIDRHIPPVPAGAFKPSDGTLKWGADRLMTYDLQPLADIHMIRGYIEPVFGLLRAAGDRQMVTALVVTAALILLIAAANFINLMTARANRRAVEVGVRKISGSSRLHLTLQFVGESLLYIAASLVAAAAAVYVVLPQFNAFVGRDLLLLSLGVEGAAVVTGAALIVGLLGGVYPALIMSAFRPSAVLKAANRGPVGSGALRQCLVVAQFSTLIALMVTTIVIARQTTFAMNSGFRLDTDQLLLVAACPDAFKDKVKTLPGVRGAACVDAEFMEGPRALSLQTLPDGTQFTLHFVNIGAGVLELYGLSSVAGRFPDAGDDASVARSPGQKAAQPIWLNETAVRRYGFDSPEHAVGRLVPGSRSVIAGVVPDFPVRTLREAIEPTGYRPMRAPAYLLAKLDGGQLVETLAAIDGAWQATETQGRPISRRFYDQLVEALYADMLRHSQVFIAFAATAVVIAGLGLLGLSAFAAEQRTKEIGVRKSMGASRRDVLMLVLWQFVKPVLWANVIAWPIAYFAMQRWLEGFTYRIDLEPWMFVSASAAGILIALTTVIGHSLLVARAHPVSALRYE